MLNRHSIRLKKYDYSQPGFYFITICVQDKRCLFGSVINKKMILNEYGKIANEEWRSLKAKYPHIKLHEYTVMPNHFHGIIEITSTVGAGSACPVNVNTNVNISECPNNDILECPNNDISECPNNDILECPNNDILECANNDIFGYANENALGCAENNVLVPANILGKGQADPAPTADITSTTAVTIGNIVGYFKYQTTEKIDLPVKLWQRNYYESVIRDAKSYQNRVQYVIDNPMNWERDKFYFSILKNRRNAK